MDWIDGLQEVKKEGCAAVLVTVIGAAGSTPRNSGTKMLVTATTTYDTIGGGQLEYLAIQTAHQLMADQSLEPRLEKLPLGPKLGQCCGGSTTLLLEPLPGCDFQIAIFGAGHVGQALIPVLSALPCKIRWIDSRKEQFPSDLPRHNVKKIYSDEPVAVLNELPRNSWLIILTHNHQLDYELCSAALKRDDFAFLGVIGSNTKARRFRQRLEYQQFSTELIAKLHCPIGLPEIKGKKPAEVAIAIAAQLLAQKNSNFKPTKHQGIRWHDLRPLLDTENS